MIVLLIGIKTFQE